MKKILSKLKDLLPITRGMYKDDIKKLLIIIKGIKQSETQHAQIETNLLKKVAYLESQINKDKETKKSKKSDIAYG